MAANLSQREKEHLQEIFQQFDCDGSGKIPCRVLKQVMDTMNVQVSDSDINNMIKDHTDGSGKIDFDELVNMFAATITSPSEDKVKLQFQAFDINGDHMLTKEELSKALRNAGQPVSKITFDKKFAALDKNGDGTIDYEESVKMLKR